MKDVTSSTIAQLEKIQKQFIWENENPKFKRTTLCNEYEQGGLKIVYIFSRITSIQYSWVKRLYDDSFHAWKVIPLIYIKLLPGNSNKVRKILIFSPKCFISSSLPTYLV